MKTTSEFEYRFAAACNHRSSVAAIVELRLNRQGQVIDLGTRPPVCPSRRAFFEACQSAGIAEMPTKQVARCESRVASKKGGAS